MAYNKQSRPNYFKQNIQKGGEDFLDKMNADVMQRDSIRAIRDLVRGNIDIKTEGVYFLNNQFLENCLIAVNSKYCLHSVNSTALTFMVAADPNMLNDPNIQMVHTYNQRCMAAYGIVLEGLTSLQSTRNTEFLFTLVNRARDYRYDI